MTPDLLLLVSLGPWAAWAAWRAWAAWAASAAWVAWAAGKLKFAILWFDLSLEASKMRYCRSLFFGIFKFAILWTSIEVMF